MSTFPRGDVGGCRKIFLGAEAKSVAEREGGTTGGQECRLGGGNQDIELVVGLDQNRKGAGDLAAETEGDSSIGTCICDAAKDIRGAVRSDLVARENELIVQEEFCNVGDVTIRYTGGDSGSVACNTGTWVSSQTR